MKALVIMRMKWNRITLQDCIDFKNGKKRPSAEGKYPIYGGNGILGYADDYNNENCVVIGRVGAYCGSVYYEPDKCWISDNAIVAKAKDQSDINFIYYLLSGLHLNQRHIGTGQPLLTQDILNRIECLVPDIDIQKEISSILNNFDKKIKLNIEINNNLEQQMQALYKSWFIDFKPFGNTMPCNWKTGKLKEVLKLKRQSLKAGDNTELPYLPIDVIPMRTFALTGFKPNSEAQSSLITFDKDDIIIGAMRVYFHRVVLAPCDGITRTTCFTLAPHHKEYLSFALLCCDQDSSIDYAQSTSKGSTMPYAIWEGGLGDMEIAIPTLEIAQEFNEIVLPMLRQIQNSYFENNRLREIRDGLLPRLMSGEFDISDIEI